MFKTSLETWTTVASLSIEITAQITKGIPQLIFQVNVHGRLNASWKICSLAAKGQSFLVIDGYLLNLLYNRLKEMNGNSLSFFFLILGDCPNAALQQL